MSKEDNLKKLPEMCAIIRPASGEGILLKRGEIGYWPAPQFKTQEDCDKFNSNLQITKEQIRAMEVGSIFGFDCPGASPEAWRGKI